MHKIGTDRGKIFESLWDLQAYYDARVKEKDLKEKIYTSENPKHENNRND